MNRLTLATFLTTATLAATGCQDNKSNATAPAVAPNAPTPVGAATPPVANPAGSTRLRFGPAPLSYLLGPGGILRVHDATTKKDIAKTMAPPQSTLTIDPRKGVLLGTTTLAPGPLPDGHQYEIWLDKK